LDKLKCLLEGYERKIKLSEYDKNNIIVFSLRYLFSDENWYNYWSINGTTDSKVKQIHSSRSFRWSNAPLI
jgi:hypothetical protein